METSNYLLYMTAGFGAATAISVVDGSPGNITAWLTLIAIVAWAVVLFAESV